MMNLSDLWKHFRLLTDMSTLHEKDKEFLHRFLTEEYQKRTQKRIEYLMRMSGIKRIKLMSDFDWKFNPKVPRDKLMEFMNTDWLKRPCNVIIMGPAGVGKTHIATSLCHEALTKGHQTMFLSLFDLAGKMAKAKTLYSFVEYYSKVPVLCLDELGYAMLTKESRKLSGYIPDYLETHGNRHHHCYYQPDTFTVGKDIRHGDRLCNTRQAEYERKVYHF